MYIQGRRRVYLAIHTAKIALHAKRDRSYISCRPLTERSVDGEANQPTGYIATQRIVHERARRPDIETIEIPIKKSDYTNWASSFGDLA